MVAIGKSKEYATNAGNLCKSMAEKMKLGIIIWDDTKETPLKINELEVSERQNSYKNVKGLLKS